MMNSGAPDGLQEALQALQANGFAPVEQQAGGPMGSAKVLLTDGVADVSVLSDRGKQGVGVGVRGGNTYGLQVWIEIVENGTSEPSDLNEQIAWVLDHMAQVRSTIEGDAQIEGRLREVNWKFVKEALGLGADADPNDPRTWRRA